jgi:regulator of protease activity HflC (stomatin/prohibitin superfamily)
MIVINLITSSTQNDNNKKEIAMFGFQRYTVTPAQRAIEYRDGRIVAIHGPGTFTRFLPGDRSVIQVVDATEAELNLPQIDSHLRDYRANDQASVSGNESILARQVDVIDVGSREVALVYKDERLARVLAPGARAVYWKNVARLRVERAAIQPEAMPAELVRVALSGAAGRVVAQDFAALAITRVIAPHEIGVLSIDGQFVQIMLPGSYGFWKSGRPVQIDVLDTRVQTSDVCGQEILTRDKLSVRVNVGAAWKVIDAKQAKFAVLDYKDALYRELQFALRQAVGTRTLDELLANKQRLDGVLFDQAAQKAQQFGVEVQSVGVKDIILPGDMKELLNQVVQAEKAALANVIKRREETAATRSLLNTAKLMDESPTLMRLKELEALEKVAEKVGSLTVLGGLDGLMKQLVQIKAA